MLIPSTLLKIPHLMGPVDVFVGNNIIFCISIAAGEKGSHFLV